MTSLMLRKYASRSVSVARLKFLESRQRKREEPELIPPIEVVSGPVFPPVDMVMLELAGKIAATMLAAGNVSEEQEDEVVDRAFRVAQKVIDRSGS